MSDGLMIGLFLALLSSPASANEANTVGIVQPGERLIIVDSTADLDPCSYGRARNLHSNTDAKVSVHFAPEVGSQTKDAIADRTNLWICDGHDDWLGVVYQSSDDDEVDCQVGSAANFTAAYRGPCRFGWIHAKYVEGLAG